ncbi:GNAT family N-acetyltransferase [Psychromonas aquimarina]|uniref:GNAT family N-acetyltransferase n=1 Tax=Psychromonas aquimarina TaxID=444919 RepID=UPI0004007E10|nr:GNAT family N-acetyltransferase [Psychromonas aquimarina]
MINNSKLKSLAFTTARLEISNPAGYLQTESSKSELLSSIVDLFSPSVVESLPPYFHGINTESKADIWLTKMLCESHLYVVNLKDSSTVIGFVFLYESDNSTAHLGYLLGENFWHRGYASELLLGLIECCHAEQLIKKLVGGVDSENTASVKLLEKVGFISNEEGGNGVTFYEYTIS